MLPGQSAKKAPWGKVGSGKIAIVKGGFIGLMLFGCHFYVGPLLIKQACIPRPRTKGSELAVIRQFNAVKKPFRYKAQRVRIVHPPNFKSPVTGMEREFCPQQLGHKTPAVTVIRF